MPLQRRSKKPGTAPLAQEAVGFVLGARRRHFAKIPCLRRPTTKQDRHPVLDLAAYQIAISVGRWIV